MKEIKLTQGYVALVDDEDYEMVKYFKWHVFKRKGGNCYAFAYIGRINNLCKEISLHQLVFRHVKDGYEIDHIDGNGLNNQKNNLRLCTHQENCRNKVVTKDSKLPKGVSLLKDSYRNKRYLARIRFNDKLICLGTFYTEKEASDAYNKASIKYFGEFVRIIK